MKNLLAVAVLVVCHTLPAQAGSTARAIPSPLAAHPGNIFLASEPVAIAVPAASGSEGETWRATDFEGRIVAEARAENGRLDLGRLPVGYYEVASALQGSSNTLSLGVLAQLRAPTPLSSPIGIDVAMSWFYPSEKMASVASLCALAGMNRVRDRLTWAELEPHRGEVAGTNRYDLAPRAQSAAGLQVLQVLHLSPPWANPNTKRFPLDLRDAYNFQRAIAKRWRGEVAAFEPWNEADIPMFGGHTGSEMASLQKAAYLGLKAGNPKATACWNVFALHRAATLRDFADNAAWPYFDTFNLHHYEPLANYPRLYADFRAVSAGRPLWVSECSVPVKWHGDERVQEPSPADLRVQSERVARIYSLSLHEGAEAVFYFMLPHYVEGPTQFGVLHRDLTPRPAYLALAAAGRLLADARPLGRLQNAADAVQGYCFAAKPDGKRQQVLVVWSDQATTLDLPLGGLACFDHLGRPCALQGHAIPLNSAPRFVLFPLSTHLPLTPPPQPPPVRPGKPSNLVLQAVFPETSVLVDQSAYQLTAAEPAVIQLFAYNFGRRPARGHLVLSAPARWEIDCPSELEVSPGDRKAVALHLRPAEDPGEARLRIAADFGRAGEAVLSLQFQLKKP